MLRCTGDRGRGRNPAVAVVWATLPTSARRPVAVRAPGPVRRGAGGSPPGQSRRLGVARPALRGRRPVRKVPWLARRSELVAALRGQQERTCDGNPLRRQDPADAHVRTIVALRMGEPLAGSEGHSRKPDAEGVRPHTRLHAGTRRRRLILAAAVRAARVSTDPSMAATASTPCLAPWFPAPYAAWYLARHCVGGLARGRVPRPAGTSHQHHHCRHRRGRCANHSVGHRPWSAVLQGLPRGAVQSLGSVGLVARGRGLQ
jgi:hypothetical protein